MKTVDHFYVFPECVRAYNTQLKVNITDGGYEVTIDNKTLIVDNASIRKNTSNIVMFDTILGEMFLFKDFDSVTKKSNISANNFLKQVRQSGLLQIDWFGTGHFVKAFLPIGQVNLLSDTHDFSQCSHFPISAIHPVDWQYQPDAILRNIYILDGGKLDIRIESIPSMLSDSIYYRYGSQSGSIPLGLNDIVLNFEPRAVLQIGKHEGFKYSYRDIDVEELLYEKNRS